MSWKNDLCLKDDLEKYVRQNYKRAEILDFVNRDYDFYFDDWPCSMNTLARMLKHFEITYIDYTVPADEIKNAVGDSDGKSLGYRAMTAKIRQKHGLCVPWDIVYATMATVDQNGLENRRLGAKNRKREKNYEFTK